MDKTTKAKILKAYLHHVTKQMLIPRKKYSRCPSSTDYQKSTNKILGISLSLPKKRSNIMSDLHNKPNKMIKSLLYFLFSIFLIIKYLIGVYNRGGYHKVLGESYNFRTDCIILKIYIVSGDWWGYYSFDRILENIFLSTKLVTIC